MYYIKARWSDGYMYYKGQGYWVIKDSVFHAPKKYNRRKAIKKLAMLKDLDHNMIYELEEVI